MKMQTILNRVLVVFNIFSLYIIFRLMFIDRTENFCAVSEPAYMPLRFQAYVLYITSLSNLYFLFFLMIKKKFKD